VFLTNRLDLTALEIAALYRRRWQIELFFRWIKQNLKIKAFYGTSKNAVLIQIWTALIDVLAVNPAETPQHRGVGLIRAYPLAANQTDGLQQSLGGVLSQRKSDPVSSVPVRCGWRNLILRKIFAGQH
jgi:hypothetical protein